MEIMLLIQTLESLEKDIENTSLSAIEKDILLKKIASLYENLLNRNATQQVVQKNEQVVENNQQVQELKPIEPIAVQEKKAVEVVAETTIEENSRATSVVEEDLKKNNNLLDSKIEKPLLNERFQPQSKGLNERVAQGDLKKLIDFNRQFVFIQELFQNDAISYMKTIERINETEKIEDAILYLNNEIIHKYKWKPEQESVKLFEKIVRQKFGV